MTTPIAIQLYSVRDELAGDFDGIVEDIAGMGYAGVELIFNLPGTSNASAARLLQALDLEAAAAHTPLPLGENKNKVLDFMQLFGSRNIVTTLGPSYYETLDAVLQTCDRFNEANAIAQANDMTFGTHNHWWEYEKVEGRYVYEIMLERLAPTITFELDTYWIQAAGIDPVTIIDQMGPRAPLIHIKDGSTIKDEPQVAVGAGTMDIPAIVQASKHADWLIVELDSCATDMMQAVRESYDYLVGGGWARGR
ncbi:MAG: sugar phosphate isomerase/epimerase [Proteobacteria bacterium]|nr:sugar phosphate isomerase/epimerase [Pseudomonadota bacterium]